MKTLELKIPPPVVALLFALLMWLMSYYVSPTESSFGLRLTAALLLVVLGQSLTVAGMVSFRRARTRINPLKPSSSSSVVSSGVYRFTRNPMYLGLALTLAAWVVYLSSPLLVVFVLAFVVYITRFQVIPEEIVLASLFGAEYAAYKTKVRRWL